MRQIVILAGGKGTRLKECLGDLPKPMVCIMGKPLLEHQVLLARHYGFTDIVILLGFKADSIINYFGAGEKWGVKIRYIEEPLPRGTAGAVVDALDVLAACFIVMYGDTMLDVDLDRFYNEHKFKNVDATLFLHPNDHPHDSDLVDVDTEDRVTAFYPYPHDPNQYYANLVNAALYVMNKASLECYRNITGVVDFGKELFPKMLLDGKTLYGYRSPEYIKDVGTPSRLARVEVDMRSGLVAKKSLTEMTPAVFLDRDGTLNVEIDRVSTATDLELIDNVAAAVKRLNQSFYRTAIITNQPVIARGDCSEAELKQIHNKLESLLGRDGAYVDAIYYCPHHPHQGFKGEVKALKVTCSCRKPSPGLINKAAKDMNIDLEKSWLIGDSTTDIMAARNAGIKSILMRTGHGGSDKKYPVRPDYEFYDLGSAVDFILETYPAMLKHARGLMEGVKPGGRVLIAGLAHAGKSTWASMFRCALEERGLKCTIIPLDSWLKSASKRGPGGVLERYDISAIEDFVTSISNTNNTIQYTLPFYDRYQRIQSGEGEIITVCKDDVVIIEGVIGLLIDSLRNCMGHKIFVECTEKARRRNFWLEYLTRGGSESEINKIFQQREIDEVPYIRSSKSDADQIVSGIDHDYQ